MSGGGRVHLANVSGVILRYGMPPGVQPGESGFYHADLRPGNHELEPEEAEQVLKAFESRGLVRRGQAQFEGEFHQHRAQPVRFVAPLGGALGVKDRESPALQPVIISEELPALDLEAAEGRKAEAAKAPEPSKRPQRQVKPKRRSAKRSSKK